jgi:hypothetical protein
MPTMQKPLPRLRLLTTADDETTAASTLGAEHPLVRSLARERTRMFQLVVTAIPILLGVAGVVRHDPRAPIVLGAAVLVALGLVAINLFVRQQTREHARALIATGRERLPLRAVARERRALSSSRERFRLARSLERHLRDAERWDTLIPQARPLVDVRRLRFASREAREVVARLRSDAPSVVGIAAVFQLLTDSRRSPLFGSEAHELRRELVRIADLLAPDEDERAAA